MVLESLAVTSDGEKIAPPKFLGATLKRLRRLQLNLKHKREGSKRLAVARRRVAKLHAKVGDRRLDFLHKLSTRLIRENQTIYMEDLNVSGMLQNKKLAKPISDAGLVVSQWEPTSQTCSVCGKGDGKKELS